MEEQQEQPQIRTSPYQSPMHAFAGSIVLLTNPENELHKLELKMRGLAEVQGRLIVTGEPLLNERGVQDVLAACSSVVSRVTVLSKIDEKTVCRFINEDGGLTDTLNKILMNQKRVGIKNLSDRDLIVYEAQMICYFTMRRADEEGERRFWKGSQQEITTNIGGVQKKAGLMAKALGWGAK